MDARYTLRHRNRGTLFRIASEKLHRRLQYLDRVVEGGVSAHQRPDTRPGVEASETIYVLDGLSEPTERLVAVERRDEARLQGHASLMSEPAAMPVPRGAEDLIAFAEKAKNGGRYAAANAAFALALHEYFPSIECSLSVRERPKTPTGGMTDGYYDLAYIQDGEEETCIPIPKLRGAVAYWFAAHADRREPISHNRDTSGAGPTIADLEAAVGRTRVRKAALAILGNDSVRERYASQAEAEAQNGPA
ncbi:hypothetical protein [Salinibacter altiplanensis]|uniref:hypothetical protein n=1 Tax=Salinibacter altiplanensis TaxID=1803181 RepID=UPI001E36EA18|nr:hypothetical protein [Salinibacter altiplanensis]